MYSETTGSGVSRTVFPRREPISGPKIVLALDVGDNDWVFLIILPLTLRSKSRGYGQPTM